MLITAYVGEYMESKGTTPPLLVGVQTCTASMEINIAIFQKIGNQSTSRPSNTIFGHIAKGYSIIPQVHVLNYIHSSIFVIART